MWINDFEFCQIFVELFVFLTDSLVYSSLGSQLGSNSFLGMYVSMGRSCLMEKVGEIDLMILSH
jgi:hypothetical protein